MVLAWILPPLVFVAIFSVEQYFVSIRLTTGLPRADRTETDLDVPTTTALSLSAIYPSAAAFVHYDKKGEDKGRTFRILLESEGIRVISFDGKKETAPQILELSADYVNFTQSLILGAAFVGGR